MKSRHHAHAALFCFRLQPTWRLGRGAQKCGYISRKKTTTGPLAVLAKRLFRQRGGGNYHYSETFVHTACNNFAGMSRFRALRSEDNVNESQPSNSSAANFSASSVNIEGKLLQTLSIVLVPFVSLCKPAFTICLFQFYFYFNLNTL